MKKNDWILILGITLYSFLFYQQSFGINFLIFSVALISLLVVRDKTVLKNKNWLFVAAASVLSGACVAYYGNTLSFIANIISLAILSAYSINEKTSIITSLFFSIYSILASFVFVILDTIERAGKRVEKAESKSSGVKFLIYAIPFIVVLVFFFMYKASNPLFDNFTKKINLDFISFAWIAFTIGGFFLMYGFFYHKRIKYIANGDELASNSLSSDLVQTHKSFFRLTIDNEKLSGVVLFLMLNLLLLTVNVLDANYLFLDGTLPKDLSYSSFVHQGTGMLITSIIIAILIIMYYFRGALNFYQGNKVLKMLAFLWIAQNAFMIISTTCRNDLYINEYSLTYKRIGVYVWLLLAMIGLLTTFLKIFKERSNWFLFRSNGWLFYTVLIASCFFNWDGLVSEFNIKQAEAKNKPLDKIYLTSLSYNNLPQLLSLKESIKDSTYDEAWDISSDFSSSRLDYYSTIDFKTALSYKVYSFLREMQGQEWKSFCFEKQSVHNSVLSMKEQLTEINLSGYALETLQPLKELSELKTISFSNNHLIALGDLALFPKLETVVLSYNSLDSIDFMPKMEGLQRLFITNNNLKKVYGLKNVENLFFLDISNNQQLDFNSIPRLEKLTNLIADNVYISDFKSLKRLPALTDLSISNSILVNKNLLPALPNLQRLNISNNLISVKDTNLFKQLASYKSLTYLNLSDNHLEHLYPLTVYVERSKSNFVVNRFEAIIPSLKSLDISRNLIHSIEALSQYKELEELYLTGNTITFGSSLENFKNLKVLSIDNCGLRDITFLKKITQLEVLSIGMNSFIDYSPLYSLKNLKTLYVGAISQSELNKLTKALPNTKISSTVNTDDTRTGASI